MLRRLRGWSRRQASVHPRATRRLAGLADRLGAHAPAERLRQVVDGPAPIRIEVPERLLGPDRSVVMHRCDGRDAVAATIARDWRAFEPPMPDAFVTVVRECGGSVLDVGANTGLYTLLAKTADPGVEVVAFEPFPPVAALLRRNLALNGLEDSVRLEELAVSDHTGTAELFVPDPGHGHVETSSSLNPDFKEQPEHTVTVDVDTIDRYLQDRPVATPPSVIKVDVESLEHAVLDGARGTLADHRPLVFLEVLHIGDPHAIERLRVELGYVDVRLGAHGFVVGETVRHDPEAWNHLLVPTERLDAVESLLDGIDLAA